MCSNLLFSWSKYWRIPPSIETVIESLNLARNPEYDDDDVKHDDDDDDNDDDDYDDAYFWLNC